MTRPVALVTGARQGIGRGIAEALGAAGFDIAATDLVDDDEAAAAAREAVTATGARFHLWRHDVAHVESHPALLDHVIDRFGGVDVLVNNAGRGAAVRGDCLEITPENFDAVMDVNLRGTVFLTQVVARHMLAAGRPHPAAIVTVTSVSAELVSHERADYCISKAGLSMWVKALAVRLADHGIAVFEVRPGIIRTGMTAPVADRYDARIADGLVPARRWGQPADVAAVVAALAGGRLGFATGSVVAVDGALSIPRL
ncbi:3-ketoacyl-ACP reductase [Prosthecomicrobium sp. N25]|uniref:3-ketoacyl-ACP reductase n=1 Tax=Prosthecomicrobium sp. N25 TaxID=3129254 RepID=UPI0030773ED1